MRHRNNSNSIAFVFFVTLVCLINGSDTTDLDDLNKFKENGLLTIEKIAVDMSSADVLITSISTLREKLVMLNVRVEQLEHEIITAVDREKRLLGNIGSVLDGLVLLVNGIHRGSWQDLVTGGLEIAIPLATMADASDLCTEILLSLVSNIFDIFGGSTGGEIKTERMVQRIITFALGRANETRLEMDVSSTKRLFSSLSNNILQLRDGGSINKNQAMEFFNQAFEEMAIFGKIEEIISTSCAISDISRYSDQTDLNNRASKCLEFLNLYSSLTVVRQLLITDMASLVLEAGLNNTAMYLLKLIRKKQETNKNILLFMVDPINFVAERYAVNTFYGSPESWPVLKAYIHRLDIMTDGKFLRAHVVVCTKQQLQGECYQMTMGKYKANELMLWRSSISSIYVGGNLKVTGFDQDNFKGNRYGPFVGPTAIGTVPGRNEWESMFILATKRDASRYMRVCEENELRQKSPCDLFGFGLYKRLDDIHSYDWSGKINSISIPSSMKVTAYDGYNFQGNSFGPFRGPDTINNLCHSGEWKSLKLEKSLKQPSEMVRICREIDFEGYCDFLDEGDYQQLTSLHGCSWNNIDKKFKSMRIPAGFRVYLWTEKKFQGLPIGPYTGPSLINSIDGAESQHVIRSLKIKILY